MSSSQPGAPAVSVVAVNWNGIRDCASMLESVLAQTLAPREVVVVDNGSRDGSREWFAAQSSVTLIENPGNLGFARAVNQGLARTEGEFVLLLNLDVVLEEGFLEAATARMERDPRNGSVAGRLRRPAEGGVVRLDSTGHLLLRGGWVLNRDQGAVDDGGRAQAEEVFGASAAAALYRREMLQDIALDGEPFCADLFSYLEDVDVDWRARWRGWRCWYEPGAVAVHRRGGSGLHATSAIERHVVANRATVLVRNAPPAWLRAAPLAESLCLLALRTGRAAVRHPLAALGAADALRRLPRSLSERRQVMGRRLVEPRELERWAVSSPWGPLVLGRGLGARSRPPSLL